VWSEGSVSAVTDIVAISQSHIVMDKVADLAGGFLSKRYEDYGSLRPFILNYDHPDYDNLLQAGGKVGGANILWFTLNHQSADDFVKLLKEQSVNGITLWIDYEYDDNGPRVVVL
jgi:hypothetical protein